MGYCRGSKDVLLWTSSHGCAIVGQSARTCLQQLCADTGCSLEGLPGAMDDRDGWRELGKFVSSATLIITFVAELVFRYLVIWLNAGIIYIIFISFRILLKNLKNAKNLMPKCTSTYKSLNSVKSKLEITVIVCCTIT